jgi:hypothetical protein
MKSHIPVQGDLGLDDTSDSDLSDGTFWNARPRSDLTLVGAVVILTATLGWLGAFAVTSSRPFQQ